jgi:hypothetical protein
VHDDDCDDRRFSNGRDRCAPGAADADARGCRAGAPACLQAATCDEAARTCGSCRPGEGDDDGDGVLSLACGGGDCDDADARRLVRARAPRARHVRARRVLRARRAFLTRCAARA